MNHEELEDCIADVALYALGSLPNETAGRCNYACSAAARFAWRRPNVARGWRSFCLCLWRR